jgi:hypothetical protein
VLSTVLGTVLCLKLRSCHLRAEISVNRDNKQRYDVMSGSDNCHERDNKVGEGDRGHYFIEDGRRGPFWKVTLEQKPR